MSALDAAPYHRFYINAVVTTTGQSLRKLLPREILRAPEVMALTSSAHSDKLPPTLAIGAYLSHSVTVANCPARVLNFNKSSVVDHSLQTVALASAIVERSRIFSSPTPPPMSGHKRFRNFRQDVKHCKCDFPQNQHLHAGLYEYAHKRQSAVAYQL